MSHKTAATVVHTIGIDTGKNTLHLIGLDDQGAIVLREKIARGPARQCAAVLDRNRSWHGDALCGSRARCARPRRKAGTARLFQTVPARPQERLQRCLRGRGGCSAAVHPLRSSEDRRSARSTSAATGAISPGRATNGCDQSDPRLSLGAWHCGTSGASLPPPTTSGHLG